MAGSRKLIRISKNKIYLTPKDHFAFEQTNLPYNDFSFSANEDFFWETESISFDKETQKLKIKVVDYYPNDKTRFDNQQLKSPFQRIEFDCLDWKYLKNFLSDYKKSAFGDLITGNEQIYLDIFDQKKEPAPPFSLFDRPVLIEKNAIIAKVNVPLDATIKEDFSCYFTDAEFCLGFVSVKRNIKEVGAIVNINIPNSFILPEFNLIRNYFPKAFNGRKKFNVFTTIKLTDGKIIDIQARSPEINKINEHLIDIIKQARSLSMTKFTPRDGIDKSLFTSDEIASEMDDHDPDGNVFNQDEQNILKFILEAKEVRNKKQLEYLAGFKQWGKQKIRISLKPMFGFLFFIEGETMYHYCWELLNSHASYLWSFEKIENEINLQYKRIEEIINQIRDIGRDRYKDYYRSQLTDKVLIFNVIEHRHVSSSLVDGFVEWKLKLKERIL